jgi:hypothetical protein
MKKPTLHLASFCLSAIAAFTITSCQPDEISSTGKETTLDWRANPNSFIYPASAHPFGMSYEEWGEEFWKTSYTASCEELFTGSLFELSDNVITYSALVGDSEVDLTISKDQAFFLPISVVVNDYPCPDPDFEPAEGQSLEEFLQEGALAYLEPIENLSFSFDGVAVENLEDYLFLSDLFYFSGNPELAECYDPCITGEPQPGVHHGYTVMLKKMSTGQHTILMHGEIPMYEFTWDMTLNITVQ